ncbi:MAG: nucleotidyltransferase [Elusimicrobiota bacterium]
MEEKKQVEGDYRDFIKLLNKNNVEYLIHGAYSVIFHTNIPRETGDMDFWIKKTEENAGKVVKAIKDFNGLEIDKKDLLQDKVILTIGEKPYRIDIFNEQANFSFNEAYKRKIPGTFKGLIAYFISKEDSLKLKKYFDREQDTKDIKRLEAVIKKQKEKRRR